MERFCGNGAIQVKSATAELVYDSMKNILNLSKTYAIDVIHSVARSYVNILLSTLDAQRFFSFSFQCLLFIPKHKTINVRNETF